MTKIDERRFGKSLKIIAWFLEEGMKGKSVMYSTPKGDFLSPKAVEKKVEAEFQEIIEKIEDMLKHHINWQDSELKEYATGGREACEDILDLIQKKLETNTVKK